MIVSINQKPSEVNMKTQARVAKGKGKEDILHAGRLGRFSASAARYTSSIDIDPRLLEAVISINSAHVIMLSKQRIISEGVASKLLFWLSKVPKDLELKDVLEDVHMNVEYYVISKVGKDIGGMLNLAKSRNDQVATALRMVLRDELLELGHALIELQKTLLAQVTKHAGTIMPGYTHLQRAQPITVGHQLLAHFDSLDRDFSRLVDCYLRVNLSPMGSGALASSGFQLDRNLVADLLGFDSLLENSLDAVSSRDFATEAIYVCSQVMTDLSRIAEEIILWTSKEFSFAEISDKHASTSSMMPQKKNAIVPEIARARASQVVGDLAGSLGLLKSLPLSYNLDLQELTRNLWSAVDKTKDTLLVFAEMINEMKFNKESLLAATESDDLLFSTELADYLVTKYNLPFREAHGKVGTLAKYATSDPSVSSNQFRRLSSEKLSEILGVQISQKEVSRLLNPAKVLARRKSIGSPNPSFVAKACRNRLQAIGRHGKTLETLQQKILLSEELLTKSSENLISK